MPYGCKWTGARSDWIVEPVTYEVVSPMTGEATNPVDHFAILATRRDNGVPAIAACISRGDAATLIMALHHCLYNNAPAEKA